MPYSLPKSPTSKYHRQWGEDFNIWIWRVGGTQTFNLYQPLLAHVNLGVLCNHSESPLFHQKKWTITGKDKCDGLRKGQSLEDSRLWINVRASSEGSWPPFCHRPGCPAYRAATALQDLGATAHLPESPLSHSATPTLPRRDSPLDS